MPTFRITVETTDILERDIEAVSLEEAVFKAHDDRWEHGVDGWQRIDGSSEVIKTDRTKE